jgi:mono/diheme cytochrome c family protein
VKRWAALSIIVGALLVLARLGWAGSLPTPGAGSPVDGALVEAGRQLVQGQCADCHHLETAHEGVLDQWRSQGPDLSYAGAKFQPGWMARWLQQPHRIRPAGYLPFRYTVSTEGGDRIDLSQLPAHPALDAEGARQAAAYLESLHPPTNPYPQAELNPSLRPSVHFEKILPCGACHRAPSGTGGVSAPELARVGERLNREWALAFIADPPYWGPKPMPRVSVRSDLLTALGSYLFDGEDTVAGGEQLVELGELALAPEAMAGEGNANAFHSPEAADDGESIYLMLCSQCHGITGDGKGINAASMFVAPRNHSSFEEMATLSDDHLFSTIKRGGASVGKSALMPAWGGVLEDDEIQLVIAHLRRLSGTGS